MQRVCTSVGVTANHHHQQIVIDKHIRGVDSWLREGAGGGAGGGVCLSSSVIEHNSSELKVFICWCSCEEHITRQSMTHLLACKLPDRSQDVITSNQDNCQANPLARHQSDTHLTIAGQYALAEADLRLGTRVYACFNCERASSTFTVAIVQDSIRT